MASKNKIDYIEVEILESKPKQRHKWRVSRIVENWENCENCDNRRHKVKGKYYYEDESAKTYCEGKHDWE